MDMHAMVHIRPSPATDQVCVCVCGGGGRDGATETPGLLSEALFQRVWSSAWSLGGRVIHPS